MNLPGRFQIFCVLLALIATASCGGTRVGNPNPAPSETQVDLRLGAVNLGSLSALSLCPEQVSLVPSDGSTPVRIAVTGSELSPGASAVSIGAISVPHRDYQRVELRLGDGCASLKAIRFTKAAQNFSSTNAVTAKFQGSFTVNERTRALELSAQPIVDNLASVSSDAQVQTSVESASGQVVRIDAPAFVQLIETGITDTSATVTDLPFASSVKSGNTIVCVLTFNSSTRTAVAVSDDLSNGYNRIVGPAGGAGALAGWSQEIWFSNNITGGTPITVYATFSGSFTGEKDISCIEYSGISPSDPFEVTVNSSHSNTADLVSPEATATQANDLLFGAATFGTTTGSSGVGFNQRSSFRKTVIEDRSVSAAGNYAVTFANTAQQWITEMIIFKGK